MTCPACSSPRYTAVEGFVTVYTCAACGAIYGSCYLGDSYRLVRPTWHEGPSAPERERYFDLSVLGSRGEERRHGWFNVDTRRITQTG